MVLLDEVVVGCGTGGGRWGFGVAGLAYWWRGVRSGGMVVVYRVCKVKSRVDRGSAQMKMKIKVR